MGSDVGALVASLMGKPAGGENLTRVCPHFYGVERVKVWFTPTHGIGPKSPQEIIVL